MIARVIGKTTEQSLNSGTDALDDFKKMTGEVAGICYSSSSNIDTLQMSKENAEELCDRVISKGHTSVAEHYNVSIAFQGISKLMAIMLNSFQVYSTTERSGRYTLMTGNTDREAQLYMKWLAIFKKRIKEENPNIADSVLETRARENARYVLSVLTHDTSMVYTTNVRQWNAVCNRLMHYAWYIKNFMPDDEFYCSIVDDIDDLVHNIKQTVGYGDFTDDSIYCQDMFCRLSPDSLLHEGAGVDDESFSTTYVTNYKATYVQLAQVHRHRAIKYFVMSDLRTDTFYVPKVIRGTDLENEWRSDLRSVADLVPQATLLDIKEVGYLGDFLHKCEERICARAMLETMEQTVSTLKRYKCKGVNLSVSASTALSGRFVDGRPKLKCEVRGVCHEPCNKLGIEGTPLNRKV